MKFRFLLAIALLFPITASAQWLSVVGSDAHATSITHVFTHAQATVFTAPGGTVSSVSVSLGSAPANGDLIIATCYAYDNATSVTIQDANLNNYTISANSPSSLSNSGEFGIIWFGYLLYAVNASPNVTCTFNTSVFNQTALELDDFSYTGGGSAVYDTASNLATYYSASVAFPVAEPCITPTGNDLLFGQGGGADYSTTGAGSPWTFVQGGNGYGGTAYDLSATTTTCGDWTGAVDPAQAYSATIVGFK